MTTLNHLPDQNQKEIQKITQIILANSQIESMYLFGSFSRGEQVSDKYKEGHITYEYKSDLDILAITATEKQAKDPTIWSNIERLIANDPDIKTPVSLIVDSIDFINSKILEGNYFYCDIKKEGIVLYDSGKFKLAEPKILTETEKKAFAKRDFDFWFKKSQSFLKDYVHNITDIEYNNAAFHLHQAAEALYVSTLLVYTGYKPKTHNIEIVENMVLEILQENSLKDFETELVGIFPRTQAQDRALFELLKKAYIEARYSADYTINADQLDKLYKGVVKLQDFTLRVCSAKI